MSLPTCVLRVRLDMNMKWISYKKLQNTIVSHFTKSNNDIKKIFNGPILTQIEDTRSLWNCVTFVLINFYLETQSMVWDNLIVYVSSTLFNLIVNWLVISLSKDAGLWQQLCVSNS